jgi:signal transduction histidine kinase
MSLFDRISNIGVAPENSIPKRYIRVTNRVSIVVSAFILVAVVGAISYFGFTPTVRLSILFVLVPLFSLLLNYLRFANTSRLFLSVSLCLAGVAVSLFDKTNFSILEESQYYEFRVFMLGASILPFILFSLSERKLWMTALLCNLSLLLFYDPIHSFFNLGYFQLGLKNPEYPFQNFVFASCFSILIGCTYFLKKSFEKYETKSYLLIEELSAKQDQLEVSNKEIERHRKILAEQNLLLNKELIDKNNQLVQTNEALIQHNNDLQQFSYTVSHNLRGPVASLLGLLSLTDQSRLDNDTNELFNHLRKSATSLDVIIKDLGSIIDLRNAVSKVKQQIGFEEEIRHIKNLLQSEIKAHNVNIVSEFDPASEIYSVKSMVSSILYNLVSNAIKYRSKDRVPEIKISSAKEGSYVKLTVADNGLGLDIDKFKEKLFGLYKRFHTHVEGKGLGLFLVKLQAESLGGGVEIESTLGVGTTFTVHLSNSANPDHQIIMEKEWGRLYYDASEDTTVVVWKKALTVSEFLEFYQHCVDFANSQKCANWVVEIKQGTRVEENNADYQQARLRFANELKRTSLKRLGYVIAEANEPPDFEEYKKHLVDFYQGRISFFRTTQEAQTWISFELKKEAEPKLVS